MSRVAEFQVRVVELPGLHSALGRALGEAGEGAPRIRELLEQSVRVCCVGCGITVTADELEALALATESGTPSPRLERLRLGYCARNGCDSRFYIVSAGTGMVGWPTVFRRTKELMSSKADAETEPTESGPATPARTFRQQWRRVQLAVLGSVVAVVLLAWWWRSGARIPGISPRARQFIVAPGDSPAAPAPSEGQQRRGATNAPRNFQVR
ncbi:MAG: hypothetical protein DVB31_00500 [Verrucomicrobia bacterium]|nr:MAG: hypothetical protein DVB31_00500 [Verrucomicrobiota bacterium]